MWPRASLPGTHSKSVEVAGRHHLKQIKSKTDRLQHKKKLSINTDFFHGSVNSLYSSVLMTAARRPEHMVVIISRRCCFLQAGMWAERHKDVDLAEFSSAVNGLRV